MLSHLLRAQGTACGLYWDIFVDVVTQRCLQVREMEERYGKLRDEVENASAAREELARLRKDVRDAASQKADLENLVRDLQKEELALRVCSC